jgi:MOSC domain-containing protein YiiM
LAGLTVSAVLQGLENRGGLRAQILNGGVIRLGDPIHQLSAEAFDADGVLLPC